MAAPGGTYLRAEGAAERLLASAHAARWRAPELSLVLARHAEALTTQGYDFLIRMRAQLIAVAACCRLGRRQDVLPEAVALLRAAEAAGRHAITGPLRIELA
ncbi:MAG: hypothetical protein ACRDRN_25785, partial [Sciscionella sp.]